MYPYARLAAHVLRARRAPRVAAFDTVVTRHRLLPWDIDPWGELNNGRALTLYDTGRVVFIARSGLGRAAAARGWAPAVAGLSIRYRARMHALQSFEMRTRLVGWDARFLYIEQGMWRAQTCCSHVLIRFAMTGRVPGGVPGGGGMVPVAEVAGALGVAPESPRLPDWVTAWAAAEARRPWPPMGSPDAIATQAGAA